MYLTYITEKLRRFYIGTTDNFEKRLSEHNNAEHANSFTSRGIPWISFLLIENFTSEGAIAIEKHIKSMKSAEYVLNLKKYPEMTEKLILKYNH